MAEIAATSSRVTQSLVATVWTPLANGDTGAWIDTADLAERTVQVTGTFGSGGTVVLQGSNEDTPTNAFALTDDGAGAVSFTAAGGARLWERPRWVRPSVTAGDGTTALTVRMVSRSA